MNPSAISLYRVLPNDLSVKNIFGVSFGFSSSGPEPGARPSGDEYSLGTDSDWSADHHDLTVYCKIGQMKELSVLFGTGGIAPRGARLQLALEWTSPDSGWRRLSAPVDLRYQHCANASASLMVSLTVEPGTIRGTGKVALELFFGDSGGDESLSGVATEPGFRFGTLCTPVSVIIDADSSLFPILEESGGADGSLWEFRECWFDPESDSFSSEYVSLVLNPDHPHFSLLREKRDSASQSPLMRQVLASWIALFVGEVMRELGDRFSDLVNESDYAAEGSVADIAVEFVNSGELDTASPRTLASSAQRWLDRRLDVSEPIS